MHNEQSRPCMVFVTEEDRLDLSLFNISIFFTSLRTKPSPQQKELSEKDNKFISTLY